MIDPISLLVKLIWWCLKFLVKLITGKSYKYLSDNPLIKYSLSVVITIVIILCLILILINSFKGISHILNDLFGLDAYKYINVLDIDLEDNFNKLYLPEFIISCIGLASIISILLYIISEEKYKNKTEEATEATETTEATKTTEANDNTTSWFSKQLNKLRKKKPTLPTTLPDGPNILTDISNDISEKKPTLPTTLPNGPNILTDISNDISEKKPTPPTTLPNGPNILNTTSSVGSNLLD